MRIPHFNSSLMNSPRRFSLSSSLDHEIPTLSPPTSTPPLSVDPISLSWLCFHAVPTLSLYPFNSPHSKTTGSCGSLGYGNRMCCQFASYDSDQVQLLPLGHSTSQSHFVFSLSCLRLSSTTTSPREWVPVRVRMTRMQQLETRRSKNSSRTTKDRRVPLSSCFFSEQENAARVRC